MYRKLTCKVGTGDKQYTGDFQYFIIDGGLYKDSLLGSVLTAALRYAALIVQACIHLQWFR